MRSKKFPRKWVWLGLAVVLGAGSALADNAKTKRGRPHQVVQTGEEDAPGAAPADAAADAELEAMTSRDSAGLVAITRADGTTVVDLEGRFMNVVLAGERGTTCQTGHAARAVKAPQPSPLAQPAQPALEVE